MKNLNKYISLYKAELNKGHIQIAYRGLVEFVMKLRTDFIKRYSDRFSFTGILHGYMDYTYFYFSNEFLKSKKLKFALVLNHLDMKFELWLTGNVKEQKKYWELLKTSKWNNHKQEMPKWSIIEISIAENIDFNDLEVLEKNIENNMIELSSDILDCLKNLE